MHRRVGRRSLAEQGLHGRQGGGTHEFERLEIVKPLEAPAEGKQYVRLQGVFVRRVFRLGVVIPDEGLAADAITRKIGRRKRETQQVCQKSSEIEPRVGESTRVEAVQIEVAIDSIPDAVPSR